MIPRIISAVAVFPLKKEQYRFDGFNNIRIDGDSGDSIIRKKANVACNLSSRPLMRPVANTLTLYVMSNVQVTESFITDMYQGTVVVWGLPANVSVDLFGKNNRVRCVFIKDLKQVFGDSAIDIDDVADSIYKDTATLFGIYPHNLKVRQFKRITASTAMSKPNAFGASIQTSICLNTVHPDMYEQLGTLIPTVATKRTKSVVQDDNALNNKCY